jgi:aspartyl-tRNA(Asn)/glutamyl-tRNA(Gln) amidotransferase subunit B
VSVRPVGATEYGTRAEIKNMNSLRSLGRAIDYEIARQIEAIEAGQRIVQETRHWNEDDGRTHSMRTKEGSSDYRYFPEPDLVPIAPTDEMRARVRDDMPELPAARRARLVAEWGITESAARVLVADPQLSRHAEQAVPLLKVGTASDVVNFTTGVYVARLKEGDLEFSPRSTAELVDLTAEGKISRSQANEVFEVSVREGKRPKQVVEERGLAQVSDEGELAAVVDTVLAENPSIVEEFRAAEGDLRDKKLNALMGLAMRATRGQGNPPVVRRLIEERLTA